MINMDICNEQNKFIAIEQLGTFPAEVVGFLILIALEYERACKLHPDWPDDLIHQAAIITEEAGELTRAANRFAHGETQNNNTQKEAIQTGAMALRFLVEQRNQRNKPNKQ